MSKTRMEGSLRARLLRTAEPAAETTARSRRPNDWNSNLMVLGDFNLDRSGDPLYESHDVTIRRPTVSAGLTLGRRGASGELSPSDSGLFPAHE